MLHVSVSTVRRWVRKNEIPHCRVSGRLLFPHGLILNVWIQDKDLALKVWKETPERFLREINGGECSSDSVAEREAPETSGLEKEFPAAFHVLSKKKKRGIIWPNKENR